MCCENVIHHLAELGTMNPGTDTSRAAMDAQYELSVSCPSNFKGGHPDKAHADRILRANARESVNNKFEERRREGFEVARQLLGKEHIVFEDITTECETGIHY